MTELQTQMAQLLLVVSYVRRHPGARVADVAGAVGVDERRPRDELIPLLTLVGKPPFSPDDLIDLWLDDDDRLHVEMDQSLGRPLRLLAEEWLGLQLALLPLASSGLGAVAARASTLLDRLGRLGAPEGQATERQPLFAHATETLTLGADAATLEEAVRTRRCLEFTYYSASRDTFGRRRVEPWGLIEASGAWYLVGRDEDAAEVRIFRLDRATDTRLLGPCGPPPSDLDLRRFLHDGRFAGVQGGRAAQTGGGRARVRLSAAAAGRLLDDDQLPALAEPPASADSPVEVELDFVNPVWAASWTVALGDGAELLQPAGVRRLIRARAEAALRLYPEAAAQGPESLPPTTTTETPPPDEAAHSSASPNHRSSTGDVPPTGPPGDP